MAACIQMQQTPWLTSINTILTKTQQNLKKSRKLSQNRTKSFFLNSSDLLSTNFSLEKSDHIEFGVENLKKEFKADIEEGLETISEEIFQTHYRLKSLEMQQNHIRNVKEDTICALESTELQLIKRISKLQSRNLCTVTDLSSTKSKIIEDLNKKSSILQQKLSEIPKTQVDLHELPAAQYTFPSNLLKKTKFQRFAPAKHSELTENLSNTCETLKKACSRSLHRLDNRSKLLSDLPTLSDPNFSLPNPNSYTSELSFLSQKASKFTKISQKLENCSALIKAHQISAINTKICSELSEIFHKELKVNSLLNRLNRLQKGKRREESFREKPSERFTKININYMGESDEDSLSFTSPTPSPLNHRLNSVNSTKHTNKNFKFSGDTIPENPAEYERYSPEMDSQN